MPQLRRTPKDPESKKGGVRGTHGLGDAPRGRKNVAPVGTQGGTASATGASPKSPGTKREELERSGQEELDQEELGDPSVDEEVAYEHGLATRKTPGPGPKDRDAGAARAKDMDERRLRRKG